MLNFYKNVMALLLVVLVLTLLLMYLSYQSSILRDPLLPASESTYPWQPFALTDKGMGGSSSISLNDAEWELDFDFFLTRAIQHPMASVALEFDRSTDPMRFTDLSRYDTLSFEVRCRPRNVLQVSLHTFDERITKLEEALTFRIPTAFFSCSPTPQQIEIDLRTLEIPEWWLQYNGLELSDDQFDLAKVRNISFTVTSQSPLETPAQVVIDNLRLQGRQWHSLYVGGILCLLLWVGYLVWLVRAYHVALTADIKDKILKDRPLIAYQQLSIEPQNDREKNAVLRYMATEYARSDLSVEIAVNALGIGRNKINDILKEQLGMTFNVYLNKLRLTEAARLLAENKEANITEIAYSVGYNNVSYFNKLFKSEYGCTPKTFKTHSQSSSAD